VSSNMTWFHVSVFMSCVRDGRLITPGLEPGMFSRVCPKGYHWRFKSPSLTSKKKISRYNYLTSSSSCKYYM